MGHQTKLTDRSDRDRTTVGDVQTRAGDRRERPGVHAGLSAVRKAHDMHELPIPPRRRLALGVGEVRIGGDRELVRIGPAAQLDHGAALDDLAFRHQTDRGYFARVEVDADDLAVYVE